ncbi:MAG: zinc ribbon domain-containing protein [Chloroflexi bacterium]|nr:zinc ribbon domain-containing protein [Chloroflexota bacterium]
MADLPAVPIFSDRLNEVLTRVFKGEAPNAGRFCGYCFTPISSERTHCPHCERAVADHKPVDRVPDPILMMFKQLRRRESLVVNGFAYVGLFSGVALFIGVFFVLSSIGANVWWYVFDIVLLFVSARVLAGLLGGYIGDEVGYTYARRKLAEDWDAYVEQGRPATLETLKE